MSTPARRQSDRTHQTLVECAREDASIGLSRRQPRRDSRSQTRGIVRKERAADDAAAFIISAIEGCVGMATAIVRASFSKRGTRDLMAYLETLRAQASDAPPDTHSHDERRRRCRRGR